MQEERPESGKPGGSPSDLRGKENKGHPSPQTQAVMNFITWLLVVSSFVYFWNNFTEPAKQNINYSQFKQELAKDNVQKVSIKGLQVDGEFRSAVSSEPGNVAEAFRTLIPSIGDDQLLQVMEGNAVEIVSISVATPMWISIVVSIAPWLILIAFFVYSGKMMRNNLMGRTGMGFGNSRAKRHEAVGISTSYADVAGLDSAKRDLQDIIHYLKDPQHYQNLGAKK